MIHAYTFRKVLPGEAAQFLRLRLEALRTDPDAFLTTLEEESRLSLREVEACLRKNYVLGVFSGRGALVGTLVYSEQPHQKFSHIGILGGMYIQPEHRGKGLGKKILAIMLDHLEKFGHIYALQLKVVTGNLPAISLYRNFGFSVWATETNALFHEGKFFDQHHMVLKMAG
jgi:RimJ/RimL family protein N-acetyltransferase